MQTIPKFNERDETEYEGFIIKNLENLNQVLTTIDRDLAAHLQNLLSIDDSQVNTFYMDLMADVRKGEIIHIPNGDLKLSKQ